MAMLPKEAPLGLAQFGSFLVVGGSSTILSLLVRFGANFAVPFEVAVIAAQIAGMLYAFSLNRTFVFPKTERCMSHEFSRFALVNLMSLIIATAVGSMLFRHVLPWMRVTNYSAGIAHFIGLAACAVPSFIGHKYISFGAPSPFNRNKT